MGFKDLQKMDLSLHSKRPSKGILTIEIITFLKDKPMYGGEILRSLKRKIGIDSPRGPIYVLLRKMERDGLLVSIWYFPRSGAARRVYNLTEKGLQYLNCAKEKRKR
jgi:PadR family transcriptional regulator PadR